MKVLCIEKADKFNVVKKLLNCISEEGNKIIIYSDLSKIKLKNKINIVKKIKKILIKENTNKVILSKDIKYDKEFVSILFSNNVKIANDRWIFKMLTDEVIDKIIPIQRRPESELWITVNDVDNVVQNIIYKFSKEFKRVNIITNHIRRFKKIEEKLYEEEGIMVTITNNRRKSLIKADLILNIDFPKEILNQFAIYDNAVIVNLEGNMSIKKKRFCGRIINDIEIKSYEDKRIKEFVKENGLENYNIKDICDVLNIVPKCDIMLM